MMYRQNQHESKGLVNISKLAKKIFSGDPLTKARDYISWRGLVLILLAFILPYSKIAQAQGLDSTPSTAVESNNLSPQATSTAPAEKKGPDKQKKLPLGQKQTYRSLSPYKAPEPLPVKSVTSLPKPIQTKILALKEKLDNQPENIKLRKSFAKLLYKNKLFTMCQLTLEPYTDSIDKNYKILLAKCHEYRKDYTKLARLLELVTFDSPNDYKIMTWLGKTYYTLRDADKAVEKLRNAIEAKPKYKPPYELLIALFQETLNQYEARRLVEAMIEVFGEKKQYLNMLCMLYSKESYFAETIAACKKAALKDRNNPNNKVFMAIAMKEIGDEAQAKNIILSTAKKYPDSEFAQWAAGTVYYDIPNFAVANRYFQKAVDADKKSARSQLGLANSLLKMDNFKEALPHYIEACRFGRESQEEFRIATATVRQKGQAILANKYDLALDKCKKGAL